MAKTRPTMETALETLTQQRLTMLGRELGVAVSDKAKKAEQIAVLARPGITTFAEVLRSLARNELKAICRKHGIDDEGRSRKELWERILESAGREKAPAAAPTTDPYLPKRNDVVQVRHRQWLVEDVQSPGEHGEATLVKLVCLDDDSQGKRLDVLWELELGAKVIKTELEGLGAVEALDDPRAFAAYLHALKWSCVSATDAKLFQSPFRAGIQIMNHQLTALKKALELPRVNLFIADDVGLGKTIEAGLVMQELLLRQRVDWMLVVVPASVQLQWRDEMYKRFGLHFEIYDRAFIQRRRQERGFGVPAWSTHNRFIISYQTLRRPEYRDPLLAHLDGRMRKSLLVLDEAHTVAPASASKYAVDSNITKVIRDVAPCFEHRLFLSATPHNGHSNSFAALLELLDPQRFTRGVPIEDASQLEPVMVRRLKADLKGFEGVSFPTRRTAEITLSHDGRGWTQVVSTDGGAASSAVELGQHEPFELRLSDMLAEYTALMRPRKGRGKLVFINLQKRLVSSVEAFHRTLSKHAKAVDERGKRPAAHAVEDDDAHGVSDEQLDLEDELEVARHTAELDGPSPRARELLEEMLRLSGAYRSAPDAKVRAIVEWIRRNQCEGTSLDPARRERRARWSERRLIIFTEYGDTKRYLRRVLEEAIEDTDAWEDRIMEFHGGMSDEQREQVQRSFNGPPADYPVRILLATDAAREGINLQAYCADLMHFDIPWNPGRMEQRNGRIDRTLQPAKEVRCYYFAHPQRREDTVLRTLVGKIETIVEELGSMSSVVMEQLEQALAEGIDERTLPLIDAAYGEDGAGPAGIEVSRRELESQRVSDRIAREIDEAARILDNSYAVMDFESVLLRDAIDVGLAMAGAGRLEPVEVETGSGRKMEAFRLPAMPAGWERTLDPLRPAKERDEAYWEWRQRPLLPVTFEPPGVMTSELCQLHLAHPFVRRVIGRFLAQGFSAHDLSRVTVLRSPRDAKARVIAFARLTLFGPGAIRLHDQLVSVAAQWLESRGEGHLRPFGDEADRRAVEQLEQTLREIERMAPVGDEVRARLLASASDDFSALWPALEAEAESRAHDAEIALRARGQGEAESLRRILEAQRALIRRQLGGQQLVFELDATSAKLSKAEQQQREQYEQDKKHMEGRLGEIDEELATQPEELLHTYDVVLTRLQPVGMIYLWPKSR